MRVLLTIIGMAFVMLGVIAFAYQEIAYTSRDAVLQADPADARADPSIPLPPILGGLVLAGGLVLLLAGARGQPHAAPAGWPRARRVRHGGGSQ